MDRKRVVRGIRNDVMPTFGEHASERADRDALTCRPSPNTALVVAVALLFVVLSANRETGVRAFAQEKRARRDVEAERELARERKQMARQYVSVFRQQFETMLESELGILRQFIELSEKQVTNLRTTVKPVIEIAARRQAGRLSRGGTSFGPVIGSSLPNAIRQTIIRRSISYVGKDALEEYVADSKIREELIKTRGVKSLLTSMIVQLALSMPQRTLVEKMLDEQWDESWSGSDPFWSYGTGLPAGLPKESLQEVLNDRQLAAWHKAISQKPVVDPFGKIREESQRKEALKEFQQNVAELISLRVFCLADQYGLTDAQVKKLQLAEKFVAAQLEREWHSAAKRVEQALNGAGGALDFNDIQIVSGNVGGLVLSNTRWFELARKVFDGDDLTRYDAAKDHFLKLRHESMMRSVAVAYNSQLGMTGAQLQRLSQLFVKDVAPAHGGSPNDMYAEVASISKEKLVQAVGEQHASTLMTRFEQMRLHQQRLKEQKEAAQAVDDDADAAEEPDE